MDALNPFTGNGFDLVSMTETVNLIPNQYGRIRDRGLFRTYGISTTTVAIEERNNVLNLLPTKSRGDEPSVSIKGKRAKRYIETLHIPHEGRIYPSDYQNVHAFGMPNTLQTAAEVMLEELINQRRKHAMTLEWLRMGALRGQILDNDGSTVLVDLFTEFGITQKSVSFELDVATTKVREKCFEVKRHQESNLLGEVMSGTEAWCSATFFDALVEHPLVKEAYAGYSEASDRIGGDIRQGFRYGGIVFSEYLAVASDAQTGTSHKFITEGEAIAFPTGTMDTFVNPFAPASLNSQVNTMGIELYAMQTPDIKERWVDVYTESNPLPICKRPALLVELTLT